MRYRFFRILSVFLFLTVFVNAFTKQIVFIDKNKKQIGLKKLIQKASGYNVIFFGEHHNNLFHHQVELKLLKELCKKNKKITLSMEMFEKDTQKTLNDYLMSKISQKEFLQNSRPWRNYKEAYAPLILFAKEYKIKVIAANIPRKIASLYRRESNFKSISQKERSFLPAKIYIQEDPLYKTLFYKTLRSVKMGKNHFMEKNDKMLFAFFKAQCLKDSTMAESIAMYLQKNKGHTVLHLNGDFHSRYFLGTVKRLQILMPNLKILVIAPFKSKEDKFLKKVKSNIKVADFLLISKN